MKDPVPLANLRGGVALTSQIEGDARARAPITADQRMTLDIFNFILLFLRLLIRCCMSQISDVSQMKCCCNAFMKDIFFYFAYLDQTNAFSELYHPT